MNLFTGHCFPSLFSVALVLEDWAFLPHTHYIAFVSSVDTDIPFLWCTIESRDSRLANQSFPPFERHSNHCPGDIDDIDENLYDDLFIRTANVRSIFKMLLTTELVLASLALSVSAVKTGRTFAVNHFFGNGNLVTERLDPIVSPGVTSGHVHMVQGGSNFAMTMSDSAAQDSTCTSSLVKADKSNYWVPSLYFQDPVNGSFVSVELYYMNVYYL